MTAQVIFLNSMYRPPDEKIVELQEMQEFLYYCHKEYEMIYRHLPPEEVARRRFKVHLDARARFFIVDREE